MTATYTIRFRAMGCTFEVQLETESDGPSILAGVPAQVEHLEGCLSRFRPESELSQLNQRAGQWVNVSSVLLENLLAAKHAARLTEGRFNPLVLPALIACGYDRTFENLDHPWVQGDAAVGDWREIRFQVKDHRVLLPAESKVDLGGIAKGWTVQRLAHELSVHGAVLVNGGGDIAVRGAPGGQQGWQVNIAEPGSDRTLVSLSLNTGNIVTSATDYRRWVSAEGRTYHHIIDPRTSQPAQTDVASVTVIHPDGALADAFAKSILIQGSAEGLTWLNRYPEAASVVVCNDGAVLASPSITPYLISPVQEGEFA